MYRKLEFLLVPEEAELRFWLRSFLSFLLFVSHLFSACNLYAHLKAVTKSDSTAQWSVYRTWHLQVRVPFLVHRLELPSPLPFFFFLFFLIKVNNSFFSFQDRMIYQQKAE